MLPRGDLGVGHPIEFRTVGVALTFALPCCSRRSDSLRTCDDRTQIDPAMINIPDQRTTARLVRLMFRCIMGHPRGKLGHPARGRRRPGFLLLNVDIMRVERPRDATSGIVVIDRREG